MEKIKNINVKVSPFSDFVKRVEEKVREFQKETVYFADISPDEIWNLYLDSFPEGTNPVYKTKTEHDDSICRNFVRNLGRIIVIKNGKLDTVWNIERLIYPYDRVAKKLHEELVRRGIKSRAYLSQNKYGSAKTRSMLENGTIVEWYHLHGNTPNMAKADKERVEGLISASIEEFKLAKRMLEKMNELSLETVMELINTNNLYRGQEFKHQIETILRLKKSNLTDIEIWEKLNEIPSHFANTSIGTLVEDIASGMDVEDAVKRYEAKVAPSNYKRSKPIVTPDMIEKAKKDLEKDGLLGVLQFRDISPDEISVKNILWKKPQTKEIVDIFTEIKQDKTIIKQPKPKEFKNIREMSIQKFINDIVPMAQKIELYTEPTLNNKLFSLFKSIDEEKFLFKWDNPFSWSYTGSLTDSNIKEKVKAVGGVVDAPLRVSLHWYNIDDLDLHCIEPNKNHIYYSKKVSRKTGGHLDVDMNVEQRKAVKGAVENIYWSDLSRLIPGKYTIYVQNFRRRVSEKVGFEVEIELDGKQYHYKYPHPLRDGEIINVAYIIVDQNKNISIEHILTPVSSSSSKDMKWGLIPFQFMEIEMILLSPNYWDGKKIGNKHYFFVVKGVKRDEELTPIYNEFIKENIYRKHRKVIEILGMKLKVKPSDIQTSGFGFSETNPANFIVKVTGKQVSQVLKIIV